MPAWMLFRGAPRMPSGALLRLIAFLTLGLSAFSALPQNGSSKALDLIRARGAVNIGIKTDFPPFGILDSEGRPEGLEIDLARDVASRLGVALVIVKVTTENRFQKLEQGAVDLLIATTADTPERRKLATAVEPNYYAGGVTVITRRSQRFENWPSLRGQKLCATQGAYFNRPMSERYLLDLQLYRSTRDALLALRDGQCVGYLYSTAAIHAYLNKPEWKDYHAPLPESMVVPWAIMVSRKERASPFHNLLADTVAAWHRSGFLIERERHWGIRPSRFLHDMQSLWNLKDADGTPVCRRTADGEWASQCRNSTFVASSDVGGVHGLGLWLKERSGVDLSYVYDPYDRSRMLRGISHSLLLVIASIIGSLLLGYLAARLYDSGGKFVRGSVKCWGVYGQMTPPLLQMYLLFFGLGAVLWETTGTVISAVLVAVACLCFNSGTTVMRVLLDTTSLLRSKNPDHRLSLATLPGTLELCSPSIKAVLVNVTKQTMLASAIAVPEILSVTAAIMADQGNIAVMMNTLLLSFLLLTSLVIRALDHLERRLHEYCGKRAS